jgi:hypothetical protein
MVHPAPLIRVQFGLKSVASLIPSYLRDTEPQGSGGYQYTDRRLRKFDKEESIPDVDFPGTRAPWPPSGDDEDYPPARKSVVPVILSSNAEQPTMDLIPRLHLYEPHKMPIVRLSRTWR